MTEKDIEKAFYFCGVILGQLSNMRAESEENRDRMKVATQGLYDYMSDSAEAIRELRHLKALNV